MYQTPVYFVTSKSGWFGTSGQAPGYVPNGSSFCDRARPDMVTENPNRYYWTMDHSMDSNRKSVGVTIPETIEIAAANVFILIFGLVLYFFFYFQL